MRVEVGQRIGAGALVAAVDTRALAQALAEAEAYHRQATAQHQRATSLYEKRSITQQQLLDAVTAKDVAEARLASVRLELDKSRVRAPWGGEVAAKRVEVGDYVTPGQPVIELVDASTLKVRAPAPAARRAVSRGRGAECRSASTPALARCSAAGWCGFGAELDPRARSLDVEAEIANPDGRLKPGMSGAPRGAAADARGRRPGAARGAGRPGRAAGGVRRRRRGGAAAHRRARADPRRARGGASGVAAGEPVVVEGEQRIADGQRARGGRGRRAGRRCAAGRGRQGRRRNESHRPLAAPPGDRLLPDRLPGHRRRRRPTSPCRASRARTSRSRWSSSTPCGRGPRRPTSSPRSPASSSGSSRASTGSRSSPRCPRRAASVVTVEFVSGTDIDDALQKVRERVDRARPTSRRTPRSRSSRRSTSRTSRSSRSTSPATSARWSSSGSPRTSRTASSPSPGCCAPTWSAASSARSRSTSTRGGSSSTACRSTT
jgi:biotin carboxyl carrier protein